MVSSVLFVWPDDLDFNSAITGAPVACGVLSDGLPLAKPASDQARGRDTFFDQRRAHSLSAREAQRLFSSARPVLSVCPSMRSLPGHVFAASAIDEISAEMLHRSQRFWKQTECLYC